MLFQNFVFKKNLFCLQIEAKWFHLFFKVTHKTKNLQKKSIKNFEFDIQGVKSIEQIKIPEYVYDLEVEDNHRFFANYVLVHNTDGVCFKLNNHTKKETLETLERLNKNL